MLIIDPDARGGIKKVQHAHESFQRNVVWEEDRKRLFISSIIQDMAFSPIIIVDIESCISHCHRNGKTKCEAKFRDLYDNKKIRWLSIDGQNRSQALSDFVNGQFSISGEYKTLSRKRKVYNDVYFADLNEVEVEKFLNKKIFIQVVKDKDFGELRDMFRRLNSGVALNSQEKRNASPSYLAEWSRAISSSRSELSSLLFDEGRINRMSDREEYSRAALLLHQPDKDLSSANLDELYQMGETYHDPSEIYDLNLLNRAEEICKIIEKSKRADQKRMGTKIFWFMFMYLNSVLDNVTIKNEKGLRVEIEKRIKSLTSQSRKQLAADDEAFENGTTNVEPTISHYFHNQVAHLNVTKSRNSAFAHFCQGFVSSNVDFIKLVSNNT